MLMKEESKLRKALEKRDIKPAEFARLMDVSPQIITHWLNRGVPYSKVFDVAAKLDLPVSDVSQQDIKNNIKLKKLFDAPMPSTSQGYLDLLFDDISEMSSDEILKFSGALELAANQKKKIENRG